MLNQETAREEILSYLDSTIALHPRKDLSIHSWLRQHGRFLGPVIPLPRGIRRGQLKQCYRNCARLAASGDLIYCEGLAISVRLPIPIEHAWLLNSKGEVIEPTWTSPPEDLVYFGVPFRREYVLSTMLRTEKYGVISDGDFYNQQLIQEDSSLWLERLQKETHAT